MLTSFPQYLQLVLFLISELSQVHADGMCHNHIDASAFAVYHVASPVPSSEPTELDGGQRWGVQLLGMWQCTPCGDMAMDLPGMEEV